MFTTREAQRNLIEKGVKGIKKYDDQEAARIILQNWLERQKG
jgi:RNase H-fold protein (predicted Holliday junction resolvase)